MWNTSSWLVVVVVLTFTARVARVVSKQLQD
jgi:hypothetical protein